MAVEEERSDEATVTVEEDEVVRAEEGTVTVEEERSDKRTVTVVDEGESRELNRLIADE